MNVAGNLEFSFNYYKRAKIRVRGRTDQHAVAHQQTTTRVYVQNRLFRPIRAQGPTRAYASISRRKC